ncbi:MAG TPA: LLM class flavin-dependent oxidoreductase [Candidatus Dormibacteraeota bacterium]|nr:LLM class flavin-dependent oxidoreductase [Candidatus Dormibacteraeota bacterium]
MVAGFSIDPDQGLSDVDEARLVRLAAELGYDSAWTPSGADAAAFERCLRWHKASGLPVGISAVPASGESASFYAEQAKRVWDESGGRFTLVVGSGQAEHPVRLMRAYLPDIRSRLPEGLPLYLAALGPLMLRVAAELADGVALNWCTAEQVAWSRRQLSDAARAAGRPVPRVIEYIRTAVDPNPELAQQAVAKAALRYARIPMYRAHFERMGFGAELRRIDESGDSPLDLGLGVGAAGTPGQTRQQFERLAAGLDLPIVRVLVTNRGDAQSAQRVLEECRPAS